MKISIKYCGEWNYHPRAASLAEEIKSQFKEDEDLIKYHISMLEQLNYIMYTETGWKATPRGIGFLYNAIMGDWVIKKKQLALFYLMNVIK